VYEAKTKAKAKAKAIGCGGVIRKQLWKPRDRMVGYPNGDFYVF